MVLATLIWLLSLIINSEAFIVRNSAVSFHQMPRNLAMLSDDATTESLRRQLLEKCDMFKKKQKSIWDISDESLSASNTSVGLFGSQSRAEDAIPMTVLSEEIVSIIEQLSKINPTTRPTEHFGNNITGERSLLDGFWKLRFTTAADATFKPGKRGPATTLQQINGTTGVFRNIIEFNENNGSVRSFNVIVQGEVLDDYNVALTFQKVVIYRQPKYLFKKLLSQITIPLPNFNLLEKFTRRKDKLKERRKDLPSFKILYLDDDLRIHRTAQGQYFVQSRLYQVWDPLEKSGWKLISMI